MLTNLKLTITFMQVMRRYATLRFAKENGNYLFNI